MWNQHEEAELLKFVEDHGERWDLIKELIEKKYKLLKGRSRQDCRKKYDRMRSKQNPIPSRPCTRAQMKSRKAKSSKQKLTPDDQLGEVLEQRDSDKPEIIHVLQPTKPKRKKGFVDSNTPSDKEQDDTRPHDVYGVKTTKGFWRRLLKQNKIHRGWLSSTHLYAWITRLMSMRKPDDRWTALGPHFALYFLDENRVAPSRIGDGGQGTPWWEVDRVFFPINLNGNHWILGELNFQCWMFTTYDSLDYSMKLLKKTVDELQTGLKLYLEKINYFTHDPKHINHNLSHRCAKVPRQTNLVDCGVYVCMFLERLSSDESLESFRITSESAWAYRQKMVEEFCKYKHVV